MQKLQLIKMSMVRRSLLLRFWDCYPQLHQIMEYSWNTLETVVFVLVEDAADYCAFFGDTNCFHRRDELIPFLFLIITFSGHFHWEQTRFHQPAITADAALFKNAP